MAAADPMKGLCVEATCPVCLEYFNDPVTTDCGHNFCRACLTRCLEESGTRPRCPLCKSDVQPGNFRPNRQLVNIVEYVKELKRPKRAEGKWGVCETHEESLKLFCKEDETLICVVCDKSKEHQGHKTIPVEEAAQEYKDSILDRIHSAKRLERLAVDKKMAKENSNLEHMKKLQEEKQKITSAFEKMQKLLEEQKWFCLTKLGKMEKDMQEYQEKDITQLSEKISFWGNLIAEMEEKCQQPASEFLQDITRTLSRYKELVSPFSNASRCRSVWKCLEPMTMEKSEVTGVGSVPLDLLLKLVHLEPLLKQVPLDQLFKQVHLEQLLKQVHLEQLLKQVPLDLLLKLVPLDQLFKQVHLEQLLKQVPLDQLFKQVHLEPLLKQVNKTLAEGIENLQSSLLDIFSHKTI